MQRLGGRERLPEISRKELPCPAADQTASRVLLSVELIVLIHHVIHIGRKVARERLITLAKGQAHADTKPVSVMGHPEHRPRPTVIISSPQPSSTTGRPVIMRQA